MFLLSHILATLACDVLNHPIKMQSCSTHVLCERLFIIDIYLRELTQFNVENQTGLEDAIKDVYDANSDVAYVAWTCQLHIK